MSRTSNDSNLTSVAHTIFNLTKHFNPRRSCLAISGPMKPPIETLRISRQGRDQLIKLKRLTGIEHYNILCRWAFCASLREETPPHEVPHGGEGGVDMHWKVFAGE